MNQRQHPHRNRARALAAAVLALASMTAVTTSVAAAAACPNAAVRTQQHADRLPECRAYEQVTPVKKSGGELHVESANFDEGAYNVSAAPDGNAVSYVMRGTAVGQPSGINFKSNRGRRTPDGWALSFNDVPGRGATDGAAPVTALSEDQTKALIATRGTPLADGAAVGVGNFFVRDLATGAYETVTRQLPGSPASASPVFAGGTPDFSHVVFEDSGPRAVAALSVPGTTQVYDYTGGEPRLASVLPDGTPAPAGAGAGYGGISRDGSRIFFTSNQDQQIYVRIDGAVTKAVSRSHKTVPDPAPAGGRFWGASSDGRTALFTTVDQLVDADTDTDSDLYAYNTVSGSLSLLTPGVDVGADRVNGLADDASTVYFQNGPALYVWRAGQVKLIATPGSLRGLADYQTERVSADGLHIAFVDGGAVYVYDADTDKLVCASCRTDGLPPSRPAMLPPGFIGTDPFVDPVAFPRSVSADGKRVFFTTWDQLVPDDTNSAADAYVFVDGRAQLISSGRGSSNSYFVQASADGRDVFFSTRERLTASDVDGMIDLYDARVDGGFPVAAPAPQCTDEACQGLLPAASPAPVISSVSFTGRGNSTGVARPAAGVVSVSRSVRGASARLRVTVPAAGRIATTGAQVRKAVRSAGRASTYTISVGLNSKARQGLIRRKRLTAQVSVVFTPRTGAPVTKRLSITFKSSKGTR